MPGRVFFSQGVWHDREMRLYLLILVLLGHSAIALEEDWRVQVLNLQYDDFFNRLKQEKAYEDRRDAGVPELHMQQNQWDEQVEKARLVYIKNKKAPPDTTAPHREWLAEQNAWDSQKETARQHYVEVKHRIERLMAHAKKIPENLEYDLEP